MHEVHIAKMERGEVKTTTPERAEALAYALGVDVDAITSAPKRTPLEVWAERQGISLAYAQELAADGRIKGARKGPDGMWRVKPDAERLPPTERTRERERRKYRSYRADYQRRRRAKEKGDD